MLSGIYLVIGMYALNLSSTSSESYNLASISTNRNQAEHMARVGVAMALKTMGNIATNHTLSEQSVLIQGDQVKFSVKRTSDLPASQTQITSTGSVGAENVTLVAICSYDRGRWRITRIYTYPAA